VTDVNLAYFGTADPAYYGIDYTPLPAATPSFVLSSIARPWEKPKLPGYVAVGATVLSGVYLEPRWRLFYQNLRQENPVAVLGNSVYVYWLERWPESDSPDDQATPEQVDAQRLLAESLMSRQWFAHAITHYRLYLRSRPDDPKALTNLGLALVSTGNSQEAISALQRGLALAPDNGLGQLLLASTLFDARYPIDDVIRHARLAAAALPADASPLVLLGRALAVKGAWSEAAAMTERALEIAPNDEDAQRLREQLRSIAAQPGNTRHPTAG
jgi:tetratricopeptide (TPR) repeat protein